MPQLTRRAWLKQSFSAGMAATVAGLSARQAAARSASSPIVHTQYGKVQGVEWNGVRVFRGIPYAGPVDGAARFLPPVPPKPWTGIFDATHNGPREIQGSGRLYSDPETGPYFLGLHPRHDIGDEPNSENCLDLSILTPSLKGKRPVIIYIHGGGYVNLSSQIVVYGDAMPRDEDVVLMGINHRLGPFGYMYLGELDKKYEIGNVAQIDLVLALQWVRDNIEHFGGDARRVTLFGVSGGGGKLNTLMAMPSAKGLFHRAIIESGSDLRAASIDTATAHARVVLSALGLSPNDVDKLQNVPPYDLRKASETRGAGMGPVVDGHTVPQQIWDPTAPAISAEIPLIIGNCKDEATLFSKDEELFHLDEAGLRQQVVKAGFPEERVDSLLAAYHQDYPHDNPSDIYFRISTDRGARWNAVRQAELQMAQGRANVYLYYFAWEPPVAGGKYRAFHTAEHPLTMRIVRFPESDELSKQISGAWAAFARTGNPNGAGLPDWPAYSTTDRSTMVYNLPASQAVKDPNRIERQMILNFPTRHLL